MTSDVEFYQGDSSDVFSVKVYSAGAQVIGSDLDDFTGTFSVVKKLGAEPLLTKDMVVVENSFRSSITPDESDDLAVGNYIGVVEITSEAFSYRKEMHINIGVRKQGVVITP